MKGPTRPRKEIILEESFGNENHCHAHLSRGREGIENMILTIVNTDMLIMSYHVARPSSAGGHRDHFGILSSDGCLNSTSRSQCSQVPALSKLRT